MPAVSPFLCSERDGLLKKNRRYAIISALSNRICRFKKKAKVSFRLRLCVLIRRGVGEDRMELVLFRDEDSCG